MIAIIQMDLAHRASKAVVSQYVGVKSRVKNTAVLPNIGREVEHNDNSFKNIKSVENNHNHNRDNMVSAFAVGNILQTLLNDKHN
jgi:hypothetical protein